MEAVLGISPGTRTVGLAVLHGTLTEYRIRRFPGRWSEQKARKIITAIETLIDTHSITRVSCKVNHPSRRSANLDMLTEGIIKLCKRKGVKVRLYTLKNIYNHTHGRTVESRYINKRMLMEKLVSRYPILGREQLREHSNKHPYHVKIFEAVALADMNKNPL